MKYSVLNLKELDETQDQLLLLHLFGLELNYSRGFKSLTNSIEKIQHLIGVTSLAIRCLNHEDLNQVSSINNLTFCCLALEALRVKCCFPCFIWEDSEYRNTANMVEEWYSQAQCYLEREISDNLCLCWISEWLYGIFFLQNGLLCATNELWENMKCKNVSNLGNSIECLDGIQTNCQENPKFLLNLFRACDAFEKLLDLEDRQFLNCGISFFLSLENKMASICQEEYSLLGLAVNPRSTFELMMVCKKKNSMFCLPHKIFLKHAIELFHLLI